MHIKPFLKWAGGKHKLLKFILPNLTEGRRLIEPFVGSGAVFLNAEYSSYLLADNNADLINLYKILQNEGQKFIDYGQQFFIKKNNQEKRYYQLRDLFNHTTDQRLKAALFVYLNRHGYNGLCRYNLSGGFNVPFGRYTQPQFPEQAMQTFFIKAKSAQFQREDFVATMQQACKGDVVYCDPPYVPLSATANFTKYSGCHFGEQHQLQLAKEAERLAHNGILVIISNHYTDFTLKTYAKAEITSFMASRLISSDITNRNSVKELLAVFGG
jgi:DNA adenine methylase